MDKLTGVMRDYGIRLPVAQLVEHSAGTREVVSSTGLKITE